MTYKLGNREVDAETFVRAWWNHVDVLPSHRGIAWSIAYLPQNSFEREGCNAAITAAADFTVQRREEIRLVEEEIDWLAPIMGGQYYPSDNAKVDRIVAREQAALASLKRGMREPADAEKE